MADFSSLTPAAQEAILNGPSMTPPDGVTPNFNDPTSHNTAARVVLSVCLAISSIFFLIRVYGAWFVVKPRLSDYVFIPTFILFVAFMTILYKEVDYGYFVHLWDIQMRDLPPIVYLYNCSISLYAVTLMMIKVTILLEWLHIFVPTGTRNYFFWIAHALLWINVLFYSAAIIALNLTCIPHEKYWNRLLPGRCISDRPLDIASAVVNFLVDFCILVLPQRVIWNLNIPSKKRIGVSAVFSIGVIAVATAGYRTVFTIHQEESADITWDYSLVGLLLAVEITCGIVVFCLPVAPKALSATRLPNIYSRVTSLASQSLLKGSYNVAGFSWLRSKPKVQYNNGRDCVEDVSFDPLEQYATLGSETGLNKNWGTNSNEHPWNTHNSPPMTHATSPQNGAWSVQQDPFHHESKLQYDIHNSKKFEFVV
ncbi:hypothetical protein K449DRAFT_437007 [Hypoxylon sp. EC38]|nr:hypothetical protein K449DRAFT_437007 [Hypoxylon sp. EC38]